MNTVTHIPGWPAKLRILCGLCLLSTGAACQVERAASQSTSTCSPELNILYPHPGERIPIGTGRSFLQSYLAVQTCAPRMCRYSERDVSFSSMTPFTNQGDGFYQTHQFNPAAGKQLTYYIACQGADGSVTPSVKLQFSTDDQPSPIVTAFRAVARSSGAVQLVWASPDATQSKQYKIYRDGALIGTSPTNLYLDSGLKPNTLYQYAVAAVYPSGDQPTSPPIPAMTLPAAAPPAAAPPLVLDDFESGEVRMANPGESSDTRKYLWSVYPYGDLSKRTVVMGKAQASTQDVHSGRYAMKATVTGELPPTYKSPGAMYIMFYPYTAPDNQWHWMREYVSKGQWKPNTYNRLRFWIKVPQSFAGLRAKVGQANTQIGTYVRSTHGHTTGSGGQESGLGGNHFYHQYNIPYTGEWHQIILDTHPTHMRGGVGFFEWGDMPNPTGEQGSNYFDLMTAFYIDLASQSSLSSYPADFFFDDFEFYVETNPENVEQILSLNGTYVPSNNELFVGWRHPKGDDKTKYEVRYSFEDIHATGWEKAQRAPGGLLSPTEKAYASMEYSTNKIQVTGHDQVMIAIKPQNSTAFRQIVIPIRKSREAGTAR